MKLPLQTKQFQPIPDNSGNTQLSKEEKPTIDFSMVMSGELPENHNQDIKVK